MKKDYKDIDGWFSSTKAYDYLIDKIQYGGIFVECGAWMGKSSSYLCNKAENKNVEVYIIDTWLGSSSEIDSTHKIATQTDIFSIFNKNMEGYKFKSIREESEKASTLFDDNSCDIVYIDMDHSYDSVIRDIKLWFPKVKIGGFISGHDYHPGWPDVTKAVDYFFGKDNLLIIDDSWIYHKL